MLHSRPLGCHLRHLYKVTLTIPIRLFLTLRSRVSIIITTLVRHVLRPVVLIRVDGLSVVVVLFEAVVTGTDQG